MSKRTRMYPLAAAAAALLVFACHKGDKIAPEGATIDLAATPATIPKTSSPECAIIGASDCGTSQIIATVSSEVGAPLPDQDVRFTTTAGLLFTGTLSNPDPVAGSPIATDDQGNARVTLVTSTTATVTARSGTASGSINLQTVQGNLNNVLLNVDTASAGCQSSTTDITSCGQEVCLVATATDTNGDPVAGVAIIFKIQNNTVGDNTFNVSFFPDQDTTDANGEAFTSFFPDSDCPSECGGLKACQGEVVASLQGDAFASTPLVLTINIP